MSGDKTKLPKEVVQRIVNNSRFLRNARAVEIGSTCEEPNRYESGVCGKAATEIVVGFRGFQLMPVCEEHAAYHRKRAETTNGMEVQTIKGLAAEGQEKSNGSQN